jgi:hypothetical protein
MLRVTFENCWAFDTTVQAFVAVSDNVNGAAIYSRAQQSRFINCGGDGNWQGLTVYSRDAFSTTNANNVSGTKDTYWGGNSNFTNHGNAMVHTGFYYPVSGFTPLFNEEVTIDGGTWSGSPLSGIRFDDAARPRVLRGQFANCPNHIVFGTNCVDPYVSDAVSYFGPVNGILLPEYVETANATAVNVDIVRKTLIFRNTATTAVALLVSSASQRLLNILIDDVFTALSIDGKVYRGKGTALQLSYNGATGVWTVINSGSKLAAGEVTVPYALNLAFSWPSAAVYTPMTGNFNGITPNGGAIAVGSKVTLRITNTTAGSLTVFNWNGVVWGTITPVTTVTAGQTVLVQMYWDGTNHLVTAVNKF